MPLNCRCTQGGKPQKQQIEIKLLGHQGRVSPSAVIMPKVKLVKTLWGVDEPISSSLFEEILEEGYAGVEVIALAYATHSAEGVLVEAANSAGLTVVFQIHTSGGYIDTETGEYAYIDSYDVQVGAVLFCFRLCY